MLSGGEAGMSGLSEAGGDVGAAGRIDENSGGAGMGGETGTITCAVPTGSGCPDDLIEYTGQQADLVHMCWMPALPVSCSLGATSEVTCWVDSETGKSYRINSGPCMPDAKWRLCNEQESAASLDSITSDCP